MKRKQHADRSNRTASDETRDGRANKTEGKQKMSKKTLIRMVTESKGGNKPARYTVIAGKLTAAEMCSLAWAADDESKAAIKGNRPLDGVAAVYVASAISTELGTAWKCSLDSILCASCAATYAAYQNAKRAAATAKRNMDEAIEAAETAYKATNPAPNDPNIADIEAARKAWATGLWNATHTKEIDALRKASVDASAALDAEKEEYNAACLAVDSGYRTALALRRSGSTWREADKPDIETK